MHDPGTPADASIETIEQALVLLRRNQAQSRLHRRWQHPAAIVGDGESLEGPPSGRGRFGGGPGGPNGPFGPGGPFRGRGPFAAGPPFGPGGPFGFGGPGGPFGPFARFRLLEALEAAGRGLAVTELAEAVGVDQPRASRLARDAEEAGLLRRVSDPGDARRSLLELTDEGRGILDTARSHRRTAIEEALAGFGAEERAAFAALLSRFAAGWPSG